MGWNEPEKGKDPFKKGNQQPPDLEAILKRLKDNFKKIFFGDSPKSIQKTPNKANTGLITGLILAFAMIIWLLSGIFIVDPAEQAAILRFGKYVHTVGPGPHWIPRFISSKVVMNVDRVLDYSYSAQMLTSDENLVSVSLAVQYRIKDLQEYLFNVANPEESLQQATSSALRQVVGTTTLDQIITEGREVWGNRVLDTLIKTLSRYKTGILIVNVSPQPARAPESVQDAFDDAIKAQEDEKRFKEQAYAYAAKVVPIAEGNASRIKQEAQAFSKQVVLKATGEVAEFLVLLPIYLAAPEVISKQMYLETMQKVLTKSTKIIVDGKAGNVLYLPLDKLFVNKTASQKHLADKKDKGANGDSELDSFAGRDITRPIYRQARD
ncbi:MAG: FtsH protease activity modulator HflK [Legionella sp.]|nr:FtsH protease activity modulator HflK [Legionella sp.]